MLVVIEGGDGSGKDTIAEKLGHVMNATVINFPNDDAVTGPMIRAYLRSEWWVAEPMMCAGERVQSESLHAEMYSARAFQALNIANRMEMMPVIDEQLEDHENVVLVRYWQSGWVYGQLDGLEADWLRRTHLKMTHADLNILLDVAPETSMKRRAARDGDLPPERYEGKAAFAHQVAELYRELWSDPVVREGFQGRWVVVDANQSIEDVWKDVLRAVFSAQWS